MGDHCSIRINFRKSDLDKVKKILGSAVTGQQFDEIRQEKHCYSGTIGEINYGGFREREKMTEAKIPFEGYHSEAGEYSGGLFASFGGEMVEARAIGGQAVIRIENEEDVDMIAASAPPTSYVWEQITKIQKYYYFISKVKLAFREDVEVTTA